jgi:hypothetical protein
MEIQEMKRAVTAIDRIIPIALEWMNETPSFVRTEIMKIFAGSKPELISHYINKWDGDFAVFYMNLDEGMKRKFFNYYNMELEQDKYLPGSTELYLAALKSKNKFDVYPFESYAVQLFYRTAYNDSLELLQKLSQPAYRRMVANHVDLYGNGRNWSLAWTLLTEDEKIILVHHIIETLCTKQAK